MNSVASEALNSASISGARMAQPASGNRYRMARPERKPPVAMYSSEMQVRSHATWAISCSMKWRRQ
jgi:hypothetical protein